MAKNALATHKSTLPTNWEAQMRADAQGYKEAEANVGLGQFMSVRGGVLQFQGTPVPGNKMRGVILDSVLLNTFYPGSFDPEAPQPPTCYAFGRREDQLAPHADATDKQSKACRDCPQNKFGSAEKGRGKACKNGRRLGIIHADSLKDAASLADAPVAMLGLPPTSLASWATYVKALEAGTGKPPYGVVTEIAVVPDPKTQFKVTFTLVAEIKDKKVLGALFTKHQDVKSSIEFPFPAADVETKPRKKAAKKKTPKPAATAPARGRAAATAGSKF